MEKLTSTNPLSMSLMSRLHFEQTDTFRDPLEHDRGRIVHSKALRRLSNKTQVFAQGALTQAGDSLRSRLTHSLEVSQISRTLAKHFGLNTTLTECLALAHDIGHSPFGHSGETCLNELMVDAKAGSFEHNCQTVRQLCCLENRYYEYPGLNLTRLTILGLMKHGKIYDCDEEFLQIRELYKQTQFSLEGQLVDICDKMAYLHHDLEDGLEAKLIEYSELEKLDFWQEAKENLKELNKKKQSRETEQTANTNNAQPLEYQTIIRSMLNQHIRIIAKENKEHEKVVVKNKKNLTQMGVQGNFKNIESFLRYHLYEHSQVVAMMRKGQRKMRNVFVALQKNPQRLPSTYLARISEFGVERSVCDYIAGMTDRFLLDFPSDQN